MKQIIFVLTFASITQRVLPLVEKIKDKGDIIIVTPTDQLEAFFKRNTDFEIIRTKVNPDLISSSEKHKILSNVIKSKIEYNRLFKDVKNSKIYFSNKACSIVIYSYIKKLSEKNKVIYFGKGSTEMDMDFPIKKGFESYVMRWFAKYMLGIETVIHTRAGVPFFNLDEKFFEKIEKIKAPAESKKIIAKYANKLDVLKGKEILIAVTDSITCGFIEREEFINKINNLMEILNDIAPGKYVIKPHPRLDTLYGKMSETDEVIPSYVPLQFILVKNWEYIIGFDSGSLIPAANDTNAEVISLMDAVKYNDKNLENKMRDHLVKKSKNKIKFVKEIKDLRKILEREK